MDVYHYVHISLDNGESYIFVWNVYINQMWESIHFTLYSCIQHISMKFQWCSCDVIFVAKYRIHLNFCKIERQLLLLNNVLRSQCLRKPENPVFIKPLKRTKRQKWASKFISEIRFSSQCLCWMRYCSTYCPIFNNLESSVILRIPTLETDTI